MDILQTLENNASGGALNLAATVFGGPVQDAINLWLNGITLNLGNGVTLTVQPKDGQATLVANPVTITGTKSSATVTVQGTGQFSGASIKATFTDNGSNGVTVDVDVSSGSQLKWTVSSLWPAMLNSTVFQDLSIADVELDLTTTFKNGIADIEFQGSATVEYKDQAAVSGLLRIVRATPDGGNAAAAAGGPTLAFLAGIVVPSWSPGSIWSPLSALTFLDSGAIFSSISTGDVPLSSLLDPSKVPAITDPNFSIQTGLSFFTTLQLTTGSVQILQNFLPSTMALSLYANLATDGSTATVMAAMLPFQKGLFTFTGLQLEWDMKSETDQTITLSAGGTFQVDGDQSLTLTASASIASSGNATIKLALQDWQHPFGYQNLIVQDFEVDVILGTDGGVTLELAGSFEFGNTDVGQFTCTVGGAITDFEDPSALVFDLTNQTPDKPLTLGLLIDEITTVDTQNIPVIAMIDQVFQFQELGFWVVEVPEIVINGKTYYQGFGIAADFTIYGEQVTLDVDVEEKTGSTPSFSGLAKLGSPLVFGSVLSLSAASDTTLGPDLSVSSTGSPYYFYVDAQVAFLDVIQAELLGQATNDGFQFTYDVQAGQQGDQGDWLNNQVTVLLNASDLIFASSFAFEFAFKNVTLGPLSIQGILVIPFTTVDLTVDAALSLGASVPQQQITLSGSLTFDFMATTWNPSFDETLSLGTALNTLKSVGHEIVGWIQNNAETMFGDVKNDLKAFLKFIAANFNSFELQFIDIAKILHRQFNAALDDVINMLYNLGYKASEIAQAVAKEFEMKLNDAVKEVDKILDGGGCPAITAGDALFGSAATRTRVPHLQCSGKSLMGPALIDLTGSPGGQALLRHYYRHREEIDMLLGTNAAVQDAVHAAVMDAVAERRRRPLPVPDVAGRLEPVLQALLANGSPGLRASAAAVLKDLPEYRALNYSEFLRELNGGVPVGR